MRLPRIYFFCCDEADNLQDATVQIAEGLEGLGIPFYANCNYWLRSPTPGDYLFKATPEVAIEDCDIVVLPSTWFHWARVGLPSPRRPMPAALFRPGRRYLTVYLDTNDNYRTVAFGPEFRQFDVVFRAQYNFRFPHPANFRPWTLGISGRMMEATRGALPFGQRQKKVLVNFGASHSFEHPVRRLAAELVIPKLRPILEVDESHTDLHTPPVDAYDRLMWEQTTHRHSRVYYQKLKQTVAVACFCGQLVPAYPANPVCYTLGGGRARLLSACNRAMARLLGGEPRIVQWDSWRFWESLSAGCAAFNVDLQRYGAALPAMPRNWEHYIGVNFSEVDEVLDRLSADRGILERVGRQGQAWALQHYGPRPMAERFLRELGWVPPQRQPAPKAGFGACSVVAFEPADPQSRTTTGTTQTVLKKTKCNT